MRGGGGLCGWESWGGLIGKGVSKEMRRDKAKAWLVGGFRCECTARMNQSVYVHWDEGIRRPTICVGGTQRVCCNGNGDQLGCTSG